MVVAQLARIQAKVKNKVLTKAVTGALSTVAARAGVTPGQLVERPSRRSTWPRSGRPRSSSVTTPQS